MQNFYPVDFIDVFDALPRLHGLNPNGWAGVVARGEIGDVRLPTKSLLLRAHDKVTMKNWLEDLPCVDRPELEKWPSMKRMLAQARKAILADANLRPRIDQSAPMGRVMLTMMPPDGVIQPHTDNGPYHETHLRFHLPLVTNPLAVLYSREQTYHLPVGHLWWFNNRVTHWAANWGKSPRIHVIFEMPRLVAGHA